MPLLLQPDRTAEGQSRTGHRDLARPCSIRPPTSACCRSTSPAGSRPCAAIWSSWSAGLSARGVYTNLITAGVGIAEGRIEAFAEAGLDHLQLSFQGARPATTDRIGNHRGSHEKKLETARRARAAGLPLTINAPIHRHNIEEVPEFIELALSLGAERLEIANVQYSGWALVNRDALMPDRAAVERQADIVEAASERLAGIMNIDFVPPDYFATYPKPCMGGWARDAFMVAPDGTVLPCHAAQTIPSLRFERFGPRTLAEIWADSPAFNAFRGTDWMQEPCRRLRTARDRLGRLPMPGDGDCRRCRRDGPGLREVADPCPHGDAHRCRAGKAGSGGSRKSRGELHLPPHRFCSQVCRTGVSRLNHCRVRAWHRHMPVRPC